MGWTGACMKKRRAVETGFLCILYHKGETNNFVKIRLRAYAFAHIFVKRSGTRRCTMQYSLLRSSRFPQSGLNT